MNTHALRSAAVLAFLAATPAFAASIRMDTSPYSGSGGGEYTATVLSGYVGVTGDFASLAGGSFETFCLEHGEFFRPGDTYQVTLNTAAEFGGTNGGSDPIDDRTAFLYTNFRQGTLSGFSYGAGRTASTAALQQAIWFLEDEVGGANNAFVALANAAVAVGGEWYGRGLGNVRVMNLSNSEFVHAQDQLTLIPLPGTSAMGAASLIGIIGRRRRR